MTKFSTKIGFFILLKIALIALIPQLTESVAVMSVDLGTEFMKIAIVKPGIPMEIVLNKESRRKTPLAVSLKGNEREFGEMALQQSIKKPKTAYLYLTQILGKSLDNPAVKSYHERYPFYDIKEDPNTKTIYFQHDESTTYTPEELLAMILEYARDIAADFAEQAIDAAVITVPAYFNQAERKAVLKAAEIANIKILQLINTNVAAGLNYGVFRRKDFNSSGTTLMFFDMGGAGTTATIATFQMVKYKDDFEPNPQLTVRGVGFDRGLGGQAFTLRLAQHLAKLFAEKTKKDVFTNPKAIIKIYKEAERVKNILSANTETVSQVESLMDDVDFKAKVTREEFEKMCADLFARIKKPIQEAIKTAELVDENELTSVILVGGSTRIPKVQDELLKATNKKELGKNLNTDEAPALGAVYQAAFQSKGYKVKKFYIKDANMYPIVVDFERFNPEGEAKESGNGMIRRVLFDRLNGYPQKKVMTFSKHVEDFGFNVNYGDLSHLDSDYLKTMGSLNLSQVQLHGVKDLFEKHVNEESKGIKVHFKLDDSGILRLDKIDITFEKAQDATTEESTLSNKNLKEIGSKISSFFSGKSDESTEEKSKDDDSKETTSQETTGEQTTTTTPVTPVNETTTANTTDSAPKNTTQVQNLIVKEHIKFDMVEVDLPPVEKKVLDEYRAKLAAIKEKEKEKRKRAAAINSLEAFIFDTRDKLTQDEFVKCSSQDERNKISSKIDEVDSWLSEADDSVATKEFTEKLAELKQISKDVFFRIEEKRLRPRRLDEMKEVLNKTVEFLNNVKNLTGEDKPLTETEWNTLDKLINSTKEWRVKMLNEQAKVADNENPKLLSRDVVDKMEELKREVNYLVSKIKYFRPKTKKPSTDEKVKAKKNDTESEESKSKAESERSDNQGESDQSEKPTNEDYFEKKSEGQEEDNTTTTPENEKESTNNPEL